MNLADFIRALPQGFKEEVRERGSTLSTGQKQLISFARALAHDPKILILDEATSSVDTETEVHVRDALNRMVEGRTSVVIAHRLSTIQRADKIIVMHKGQVREMGTHQQLLAQRGIYYKLYQLQYKDQEIPVASELTSHDRRRRLGLLHHRSPACWFQRQVDEVGKHARYNQQNSKSERTDAQHLLMLAANDGEAEKQHRGYADRHSSE